MKKQKGQAIFEFLIFVPFLLIIYSVALNVFSSINGSINQQKVVRGYLFSLVRGNSSLPTRFDLGTMRGNQVNRAGMMALGWKINPFVGGSSGLPEAPCYQVASGPTQAQFDGCKDRVPTTAPTSFIRVKTVYGLCGQTYFFNGASNSFEPDRRAASYSSCTLGR